MFGAVHYKQGFPSLSERASREKFENQVAACLDNPVTQVILDCLDSHALILNEFRQVLAVNPILLQFLNESEEAYLRGLRPGELLHCVHSLEGSGGCGTSKACGNCGALLSMLAAQREGGSNSGECLLAYKAGDHWESKEFQVRTSMVQMYTYKFMVFTLKDIGAEKRRENLENVFLHDLMNILHGLKGWCEILKYPQAPLKDVVQRIYRLSDYLALEVKTQQMLMNAEQGHLQPVYENVNLQDLFAELGEILQHHLCCIDKKLLMPKEAGSIKSDRGILLRVILNMLINALEASPDGGTVSLEVVTDQDMMYFRVHNLGYIPEEVAARIFHKSFSTKPGLGRGIGTYSMKILGENVLPGEISFFSTEAEGTTFEFCHSLLPGVKVP